MARSHFGSSVVPFSNIQLKLTQTAALLIMVPLLMQLIFVAILVSSVNEAERENDEDARSVARVSAVNVVFNDALNVAGAIAMAKAIDDQRFADNLKQNLSDFAQHRKDLENLQSSNPEDQEEVAACLTLVDQTKGLLDEGIRASQGEPYGSIRNLAKVKIFVDRANEVGKLLIHRHAERQAFREQQTRTRNHLRYIIEICSCINVLIALLMAFIFNVTFAKRMQILSDNTANIAIEKPLVQSLSGNDELAQLDNVMHALSSELAIARQKERAMVANAADIILSLDERLRISQVNAAVLPLLGYKPDDLTGSAVQTLIPDEDRKLALSNFENCRLQPVDLTFEARAKKRDGKLLFMSWTVRWSKEDRTIFCTLHDITDRVLSEKLKADIMAMVSHDLRSSLNSLGITLDLLMEGHLGALNEKGERMISKSHGSVKVLLDMIHDLLEVERFESGTFALEYEAVNARDIARQAIDMVYAQADKKSVKITLEQGEVEFEGDKERLRRVFLNLLSNAIKFSPEFGAITISSTKVSGEYGENQAEVRINDQGPGIPADKVGLVFEKFKQIEQGDSSDSANQRGSGLGLAICRAIVEAHGGTIGVDSSTRGGSSFWFRIPIRRPKTVVQTEPAPLRS